MIKTKSLFFLFAMCFTLNFSASAMELGGIVEPILKEIKSDIEKIESDLEGMPSDLKLVFMENIKNNCILSCNSEEGPIGLSIHNIVDAASGMLYAAGSIANLWPYNSTADVKDFESSWRNVVVKVIKLGEAFPRLEYTDILQLFCCSVVVGDLGLFKDYYNRLKGFNTMIPEVTVCRNPFGAIYWGASLFRDGHFEIVEYLHNELSEDQFSNLILIYDVNEGMDALYFAIDSRNLNLIHFLLNEVNFKITNKHLNKAMEGFLFYNINVFEHLYEKDDENKTAFNCFVPRCSFDAKDFLEAIRNVDLTGRTDLEILRERCEEHLYLQRANKSLVDLFKSNCTLI